MVVSTQNVLWMTRSEESFAASKHGHKISKCGQKHGRKKNTPNDEQHVTFPILWRNSSSSVTQATTWSFCKCATLNISSGMLALVPTFGGQGVFDANVEPLIVDVYELVPSIVVCTLPGTDQFYVILLMRIFLCWCQTNTPLHTMQNR